MRIRLAHKWSLNGGRDVEISQLPILIGRCQEADVNVDDRWMSRRHCTLFNRNGTLMVRDLESTHGTFVNNQRVNESALVSGDSLGVGASLFEIVCESASIPRPATLV